MVLDLVSMVTELYATILPARGVSSCLGHRTCFYGNRPIPQPYRLAVCLAAYVELVSMVTDIYHNHIC